MDSVGPHITISNKRSAERDKSDRGKNTISRNVCTSDRWRHRCLPSKTYTQRMASKERASLECAHQSLAGHCCV